MFRGAYVTTTTYRKARLDDALELSKLAESTFRATFGAVNTVEHMELHCRESYSQDIQAAEISNSQMMTLVGENDGSLIGYAQMRWCKVPECVVAQRPAEIQRLYVAEPWHGKGIAQVLMNACIEAAQERGSDAVWLGVWEQNPRAIALYRKLGFTEVGEHTFPLGGDPQRDILMVRPLNSGRNI
jgi:ribosomal protein S18 acetylase RimI-like enzyme